MKPPVTGVDGYIGCILVPVLTRIGLNEQLFLARHFTRRKQIKYLLQSGQVK